MPFANDYPAKRGFFMFEDYLKQAGLGELVNAASQTELNTFVETAFAQTPPHFSEQAIKSLYTYTVPQLSPDGSCSITDTPAEKPYNLAEIYGIHSNWSNIRQHLQTERLWRLRQIVDKVVGLTHVNWFGIYRKLRNKQNEWVLVKESYQGLFSRPEFPLTQEFAKKSNNSAVGLTGIAKVIQDVAANQGPYYKCDGNVQSEFCLPIIGSTGNVIGIIDAEAFEKHFFTNKRLVQIAKVAFDLGTINLGV